VIKRILLAVEDSPDSLAAARVAIQLADALPAQLRAVHVTKDHVLNAALEAASGRPAAEVRRSVAATTVLARVSDLARAADVPVETELLEGDVGPVILAAARRCAADLVVVGRSAHFGNRRALRRHPDPTHSRVHRPASPGRPAW
jgi:nucleotide-binding universal stress UspA family protein